MQFKKSFSYCALFIASLFAVLSSCTEIAEPSIPSDGVVITATASLPGCRTKMIYEDSFPELDGIKAGWETGDTFLALEINGSTVTPVTFTATAPGDVATTFTSSGAVAANSATRWVAVLGKAAGFGNGGIICRYSGQDGSLKGLEGYDYMTASSTGENPDFKYSNGKHLTYLLRLKAPAGVGKLEFNTTADPAEWLVASDGTSTPCKADYRPKAVKTLTLSGETKEGDIVYLAVPAIDYSDAGLIVTAMNGSGTKSQGKVKSADLSAKGGQAGTFEMDALIDRPLEGDAIDFVSVCKVRLEFVNNVSWQGLQDNYRFRTSPRWAPFNIGASAKPSSAEEAYGSYFAWGETEQRESYSQNNYRYNGKDGNLGKVKTYPGESDVPLNVNVISGTKYDVARVKWGSLWRMPYAEEMMCFLGYNGTFTYTAGQSEQTDTYFSTRDVTEYEGVSVSGRTFSRNGKTIFFPFAGRYYFTEGGSVSTPSLVGKAGLYYSGTHNNQAGVSQAYRVYMRTTQVDYLSQECSYAFSVRPVMAEETDEPVHVTASGRITDSSTGNGIAGVTVSDGYNCCVTDADGRYSMDADSRARTINVTVPASYEMPLGPDGRPAFYKRVDFSKGQDAVADFTLTPRSSAVSRFTLITVSDAHIKTESNLNDFISGPVPDIQKTINELEASGNAGTIIGVGLGDQLWDSPDMAASVRGVYTGFRTSGGTMPFFYTIGNHDHVIVPDGTDIQSTDNFVENFGPTDFSFDIGNAHFVVLDNIDFTGDYSGTAIKYRERFNGEQIHWLKQDIANVSNKADKLVILCTHAPMYSPLGNLDAVKKQLVQFKEAHIFTGHIHNLKNFNHTVSKTVSGKPLYEHNIQSLCGMWWLADLSPNGTPAGYGVYTFDGSTLVSQYNKVWKEEAGFQMRVYNGNDKYNSYFWDSKYAGKFLVRVWDGDDPSVTSDEARWSLTFVHNGESTPMTRITDEIVDKCSAGYIVYKLSSPYGTGGSATSCSWWMIDAPGGNPASVLNWKVVARHALPGGWEKEYTATVLSTDYTGYASGSHFIWK